MVELLIKLGKIYFCYVCGGKPDDNQMSRAFEGVGITKGYDLLKYEAPVSVLFFLYNDFVRSSEIFPIEVLPQTDKRKYFDIACKHWQDEKQRIRAAKAAYALTLMTSTQSDETGA